MLKALYERDYAVLVVVVVVWHTTIHQGTTHALGRGAGRRILVHSFSATHALEGGGTGRRTLVHSLAATHALGGGGTGRRTLALSFAASHSFPTSHWFAASPAFSAVTLALSTFEAAHTLPATGFASASLGTTASGTLRVHLQTASSFGTHGALGGTIHSFSTLSF